MRGYKVFNPDWTCRGFQYEVGKSYEMDEEPMLCEKGFHFCEKLAECFDYYVFNSKNKVAEVEAYGKLDKNTKDSKCCTNQIKIIRELSWHEVLDMVNMGKNNSGYYNSGSYNSGSYNSGSHNSGSYNSGSYNSGSYNSGLYNSGSHNSGSYNSENHNSGNHNSGSHNSGFYNSGSYNSGPYNSGSHNSGSYNSGPYNSGSHNSGSYNSGSYNSGSYNSGSYNSGSWNIGHFNNGYFNTRPTPVCMFNKPTGWTVENFINSYAHSILAGMPSKLGWVKTKDMLDEDKEAHPEYEAQDGYLKELDEAEYIEVINEWWKSLDEDDRQEVMSLPNFDKNIFKEITGIEVE